MSKLVQALAEMFDIKRHFTSPYHPMTNGLTESKNSYILQALRAYCKGQQDDWPELLPGIMMAYRSTPCTQSTQFSPFFMLYGREMRLPIDTVLQPKDHLPQDHKVHLGRILQNLEVCRKIAGENIKDAQDKYKFQYDKRSKVPEYRPAQRVWLYCTKVPVGKAPKLHRKWVGPYYITMLGPNHTYKLRNVRTNLEVKSLVNAMRLKPYFDPEDRPTNPPEQLADNEDELDPEELDQPKKQGKADNTETQQGVEHNGNTNQKQRRDRRSVPERQEQKETAIVKQKPNRTEPERPTETETVSSKQQHKMPVPERQNKESESTKGNETVKPTDGSKESKTKGKATNRGTLVKQNQPQNKLGSNRQSLAEPKGNQPQTKNHKGNNHNTGQSNSGKNSGKNSSTAEANKNRNKQPAKESASTNNGKQNDQTNQNQQKVNQNTNGKQKKQDKKGIVPSCIDCKAGNCKPIDEKDIKAIVASQGDRELIMSTYPMSQNLQVAPRLLSGNGGA